MDKIMQMYRDANGREPTKERSKQLRHLQKTLGIEDNDALWSVIIGLDHYQWLYEQMPGRIEEAAGKTLRELEGAAQATIRASVEETKRNLSSAVVEVAEKTAQHAAARKSWQWLSVAFLVAFFVQFGIGYLAYHAGHSKGWGEGYEVAREEKAAASWASTKEGKLARKVAEKLDVSSLSELAGWDMRSAMEAVKWTWTREGQAARSLSRVASIEGLAGCTLGESWRVGPSKGGISRVCFPHPNEEGVPYGWPIPEVGG